MRIELVISRTKQLPEGAVPALEKELITVSRISMKTAT